MEIIQLEKADLFTPEEMDFLLKMVKAHTDEEALTEKAREEVERLKTEGPVAILWTLASMVEDPTERAKRQQQWMDRAVPLVADATARTRHIASCTLTKLHVLKIALNH